MAATNNKITRSSSKRKAGASFLSGCFLGSPVLEDPSDTTEPAAAVGYRRKTRSFSWSMKRETMPLAEDSLAVIEPAGLPDTSPVIKSSKSHRRRPPQEPALQPQSSCRANRQGMAKCVSGSQTAPLISVRDHAHNMTRISHPGSPEPEPSPGGAASVSRAMKHKNQSKKSEQAVTQELDPAIGLLFLSVTLVILILYGRVCATLCTCTWFYLLPRLRAAAPAPVDSKSTVEIDIDSEEYKKKIILEGLLERPGRRKFSTLSMPTSAHLS